MREGAGDQFQQQTKYFPFKMPEKVRQTDSEPDAYKLYPDSTQTILQSPAHGTDMPLDTAIKKRRSIRLYKQVPLKLDQLSYLLWASTGIQSVEEGFVYRRAPSAGALYPVETYVIAHNIEGLGKGVYHYNLREHTLEEIRLGDHADQICTAAMGQEVCGQAAVVFVWTAVFQRCKFKYGQRAYRYIYLDAGHIAENLALTAVSLGLGSCPIAAFYDDEVNVVLDVDGEEESVIYMTVAGWPEAVN